MATSDKSSGSRQRQDGREVRSDEMGRKDRLQERMTRWERALQQREEVKQRERALEFLNEIFAGGKRYRRGDVRNCALRELIDPKHLDWARRAIGIVEFKRIEHGRSGWYWQKGNDTILPVSRLRESKKHEEPRSVRRTQAVEFLLEELSQGPRLARDIVAKAQIMGISRLRSARRYLEVIEEKKRVDRGWKKIWRLP